MNILASMKQSDKYFQAKFCRQLPKQPLEGSKAVQTPSSAQSLHCKGVGSEGGEPRLSAQHGGAASKAQVDVHRAELVQPAILQPFLEKGAEAETRQHYKMAAALYEQVKLPRQPTHY